MNAVYVGRFGLSLRRCCYMRGVVIEALECNPTVHRAEMVVSERLDPVTSFPSGNRCLFTTLVCMLSRFLELMSW